MRTNTRGKRCRVAPCITSAFAASRRQVHAASPHVSSPLQRLVGLPLLFCRQPLRQSNIYCWCSVDLFARSVHSFVFMAQFIQLSIPSGCWSTAPHAVVLTLIRDIIIVYICICCVGWCIDTCCWFTQNSFPLVALSPWCLGADVNCRSCHPTYPLGAGAELIGDAVVGLREICIALARFIIVGCPLL